MLMAIDDMPRAYGLTAQVASNPTLPVNLELVTLTETSVVVTWFTGDPTRPDQMGRLAPMPADTRVLLAKAGGAPSEVFYDEAETPYHYVEVGGLEPGASYTLIAQSNGIPAAPAPFFTGSFIGSSVTYPPAAPLLFTTPQPPPGKYLFSIALCNDLHLGETTAGLLTSQGGVDVPPGVQQVPGRPPYPEVMAAALAREAKQRGADVLLAAGDVSRESATADLRRAKEFLDGFGTYERDYFVARGNHDRVHNTDEYDACGPSIGHGADYHDCFRDVFQAGEPTWFAAETFGLRILGLDTYDATGNGAMYGEIGDAQMSFVRAQINAAKDQPTIVFGHHPVPLEATLLAVPPAVFGLNPDDAQSLQELYAGAPGVFLHHAGHTHRNKVSVSTIAEGVAFQEVAATKEYPGGFHLLRVHEGGYAANFYKLADPLAQEWSERSRPEYLSLYPFYTFGNTADRNRVVVRDMSGLKSAAEVRAAQATPTTAPVGTLPATGSSDTPAMVAAGAAAVASATAWLRRRAIASDDG